MTKCFEVWIAGSHPQGDAKWIPGSKPGDDERKKEPGDDERKKEPGDDERKKEPGDDKGKERQYRKEFLLTTLSRMLLKKKKRATRKLWHNDDNCSPRRARLWEETENE